MKIPKILLSSALFSLCLYMGVATAATHPVQFAKGATSSTAKGVIKGSATEDYVMGAASGQTMNVKLSAKSTLIYFNVLKPGSDEAIFVGSSEGKNSWSGSLPSDGEYTVRVYTMGKGKDAGHVTPFSLSVSIK
ncbi:MAG: DNA breaking-rejoining protein [Proteobacteria bacterium]|nr:DNA breaking-rejoining protein [Pseudomonadota bacterium]